MQNKSYILTLSALVIACGQGAAHAQQPTPPDAKMAQQADAMFTAWDADRNKSVSQQEFRNGWAGIQRRLVGESLRAQFNQIDANKNGAIDASEYGNLVLVRRAGTTAPPLASFDTNKDQRLQFPEYVVLVERLTPKK